MRVVGVLVSARSAMTVTTAAAAVDPACSYPQGSNTG
jgi:hypothetical protein